MIRKIYLGIASAVAVFSCAASTTNVFDVVTLTNALKNASAGDAVVMIQREEIKGKDSIPPAGIAIMFPYFC